MDALLIIITFAVSLGAGIAAGRAVLWMLFTWTMQPQRVLNKPMPLTLRRTD
jgi:hypothetical protein